MWVGGFDTQLPASFTYLGQLSRCAHKRIVNIMKVYIERNNGIMAMSAMLFVLFSIPV